MEGDVDEVRVWNVAFSASEVAQKYLNFRARSFSGFQKTQGSSYWNFNNENYMDTGLQNRYCVPVGTNSFNSVNDRLGNYRSAMSFDKSGFMECNFGQNSFLASGRNARSFIVWMQYNALVRDKQMSVFSYGGSSSGRGFGLDIKNNVLGVWVYFCCLYCLTCRPILLIVLHIRYPLMVNGI